MLYFIPTPIGNKDDITLRALNLLKNLDILICEDTRTTKKLLKLYNIDYSNKKLYSLTSFTSENKLNSYLNILTDQDVGVLSEAGSPGLSDPGKQLVKMCWDNNIEFEVLPGANALLPAVISSYANTSSFLYLGFLPKKKGKQTILKSICENTYPVYIYESVYRIEKTLNQLKQIGFDGNVGVFREISKKFQQKEFGHIDNILTKLSNGEIKLKGEFVLGFFNN